MNPSNDYILFNQSPAQLRVIGARGARLVPVADAPDRRWWQAAAPPPRYRSRHARARPQQFSLTFTGTPSRIDYRVDRVIGSEFSFVSGVPIPVVRADSTRRRSKNYDQSGANSNLAEPFR